MSDDWQTRSMERSRVEADAAVAVEQFSWPAVGQRMEEVYGQILSSRPR